MGHPVEILVVVKKNPLTLVLAVLLLLLLLLPLVLLPLVLLLLLPLNLPRTFIIMVIILRLTIIMTSFGLGLVLVLFHQLVIQVLQRHPLLILLTQLLLPPVRIRVKLVNQKLIAVYRISRNARRINARNKEVLILFHFGILGEFKFSGFVVSIFCFVLTVFLLLLLVLYFESVRGRDYFRYILL